MKVLHPILPTAMVVICTTAKMHMQLIKLPVDCPLDRMRVVTSNGVEPWDGEPGYAQEDLEEEDHGCRSGGTGRCADRKEDGSHGEAEAQSYREEHE